MNLQIDNEIEALTEIYFDNIQVIKGKTNKTIEIMLIPNGVKLAKGDVPYCWIKARIEYFSNYPKRGPLVTLFEKYNMTESEINAIESNIAMVIKQKMNENVEMVLDICQSIQNSLNVKSKLNDPNEMCSDCNRRSIENRLSTLSINTDQYDRSNNNSNSKNPLETIHEFGFNSDKDFELEFISNNNNDNNGNNNNNNNSKTSNKEDDEVILGGTSNSKKSTNIDLVCVSRFITDFDKREKIGEGGGGCVFKVRNKWDGMHYAIKLIRVNIYDAIDEKNILLKVLNEGYILSRLQHPHIVRYYQTWIEDDINQLDNCDSDKLDSCYDIGSDSDSDSDDSNSNNNNSQNSFNVKKKLLFIQMEYCEGKTLKEAIDNKTLSEPQKWKLINQLLEAVNYIHQQGLIHRDIKPGNIFLDKNNEVKIGDFGLAKVNKKKHVSLSSANKKEHIHINNGNDLMTYNIGTKYYCSPEQEKSKSYDSKTDMFSIGIILFEMFYSFSTLMERDIALRQIKDKHIFPIEFNTTTTTNKNHIVEIVSMLTERNPADRPSAKELLQSPLIPIFINEKAVTENFEKIINDNKNYTEKFIDILIKQSSKEQSNNCLVFRDHYYTRLFRKHLKQLPNHILEKYDSIAKTIKSFVKDSAIKFQSKEIVPFTEMTTIYDSIKKEIIPINKLISPWQLENIMLNRGGKLLQYNTPHSLFKEISSYIREVQNISDFHPCQLYSEINYELILTQLWSSSSFCDEDAKYIILSLEKMFTILNELNVDKSKMVIKINTSRILDTIITKSSVFPNSDKKYEMLNDIQNGRSIKNQKTLVPFFSITGELETIKKKNDKKEFNDEIDSIISLFNPDLLYWNNKTLIKYFRDKIKIDFSLISSNLLFYSGLIIQVIYQRNENEGDILICEGGSIDNLLNSIGDKELFYHGFSIRFFIDKLMTIKPLEDDLNHSNSSGSKLDVLIVCSDVIDQSVINTLISKIPIEPKIEIDFILKPQLKINYQALERVYRMKVLIVANIVNKKVLFNVYHKEKVKQIKEEDFKWSDISQLLVSIQYKKRKSGGYI